MCFPLEKRTFWTIIFKNSLKIFLETSCFCTFKYIIIYVNKLFFVLKCFIKNCLRFSFALIGGGENCLICGRKTFLNFVCKDCLMSRFSTEEVMQIKRCAVCGKELLATENVCLQCRENPVLTHTDYVLPLFSYRLWNKELMFLWKSEGCRVMSDVFAKVLCSVLKKIDVKIIVPVPPRPGKIKKNGWDQIDELANFLEFKYGFKVLRLLERRTAMQQKKLDRKERLETVGKAYFLKSAEYLKRAVKKLGEFPQKVCILDDVTTTGATVESCAVLLKGFGIKTVYAVTLFSVD